jgi:hypothetical protein
MVTNLSAKRVELLLELRPLAARSGCWSIPVIPCPPRPQLGSVRSAAFQREGYRCSRRERRPRDIEMILEELVKKRTDGLLVTPDPLFSARGAACSRPGSTSD